MALVGKFFRIRLQNPRTILSQLPIVAKCPSTKPLSFPARYPSTGPLSFPAKEPSTGTCPDLITGSFTTKLLNHPSKSFYQRIQHNELP